MIKFFLGNQKTKKETLLLTLASWIIVHKKKTATYFDRFCGKKRKTKKLTAPGKPE